MGVQRKGGREEESHEKRAGKTHRRSEWAEDGKGVKNCLHERRGVSRGGVERSGKKAEG